MPKPSPKSTVEKNVTLQLHAQPTYLPCDPSEESLPINLLGSVEIDRVHLGNFIEIVQKLPDKSVDLIIADPPYNASKGNTWSWDAAAGLPGFGGSWSKVAEVWDDMPLEEYFAFTVGWLTEAKRVLKPTGSMWIHGTYHNAGIINFAMQLLGIEIINEVVWYKRNSFPNLSCRRLTASHETILWAHSGKKRQYFFNYEQSKQGDYDEDRLKKSGSQMRTVWDLPNNKERAELKFGKHPTQKPERLIRRMIGISAKAGDVCLVPFAGAGSECVAAAKEGLHFIGCEIDPEYVKIADARLHSLK